MKTISLRFADNVAPKTGTIVEHEKMIEQNGFVWYGKFGARISVSCKTMIMRSNDKRVLMIHSGTSKRYWFYIDEISYEPPEKTYVPPYYRDITETMKTWFKVTRIEKAEKNVMSKCIVVSSGSPLSTASRHSMSPYFIIDYCEEE